MGRDGIRIGWDRIRRGCDGIGCDRDRMGWNGMG